MKITPEMFQIALAYLKSRGELIKKIKVTPELADYLEQNCDHICLDENTSASTGVIGNFTGIPVVIDDTIEGSYELEFWKEK